MASDTSDLVREQGASGRVCAVTLHTEVRELALGTSTAALKPDRRRATIAALEALAHAKSDSFLTCCVMGLFSHQLAVETV